ncbi:MAG: hypothetical protein ACYCUG_17540 [Acidimicrobiales bacterium]
MPLLVPLVRMSALGKGLLPLHAVAFTHRGVGIAATGWSGSGKTALLLAMTAVGAHPVAAEWLLVSQDGRQLLGVPQPVRLKASHVDRCADLVRLSPGVGGARARLLRAVRLMAARVAPSTTPLVERALQVDVPLHLLEKGLKGPTSRLPTTSFDLLFLLEDAEVGETSVERVDTRFATERIAVALEHDLEELDAARRVFHYASARSGDHGKGVADAAHRQLLALHLASRPVFLLRHRQPTPFAALRAAVERAIA